MAMAASGDGGDAGSAAQRIGIRATFDITQGALLVSLVRVHARDCFRPACPVQGHSGRVFACEFAPDAKTIVSGSEDETLKIWNVASGTCQAMLEVHPPRLCWQLRGAGFVAPGTQIRTAGFFLPAYPCATHVIEPPLCASSSLRRWWARRR